MAQAEEMLDIRAANSDDAAALAVLNDEFNATATTAEDIRRRFRQTGNRELVYIAIEDDLAVGFACAQVYHSICYQKPMAELTEIYVRNAYRSRGIAKALMLRAESDLRVEGVSEIRIETGLANEIAMKLYMSSGYKPVDHQILVKKLG
jgi:ribosomal protein S18 acetylase RimI-like enzyme